NSVSAQRLALGQPVPARRTSAEADSRLTHEAKPPSTHRTEPGQLHRCGGGLGRQRPVPAVVSVRIAGGTKSGQASRQVIAGRAILRRQDREAPDARSVLEVSAGRSRTAKVKTLTAG